ncbi:hypothetical protein N7508_008530 [Penicillium antarcticum]|uniref:uncharacterized protein n=1 Tax=Penicillium antarcticum TaxID=416450 RepID=UPI00238EA5FE|nr:uncharacterized protein N7508_008530 [Penicillium antarcticum]KAJ5293709.1 hypothetical protein N7508_008530 [Penicillium antarcticum]
MTMFTIVQRALPPLSLPWRRRSSLKGKSPETDFDLTNNGTDTEPNGPNAEHIASTDLHSDVSPSSPLQAHLAVRDDARESAEFLQPICATPSNMSELESDSTSARCSRSTEKARSARAECARAVSWASIVRSQCRWTFEQEKELLHAQRQLARCQKAWSSEQELWLTCVQALSEEKESHVGFLSMRHKQHYEEQVQFRKAWRRRRSSSGDEEMQKTVIENFNRSGKLRRLQRHGYLGPRLGTTGSTPVAAKA